MVVRTGMYSHLMEATSMYILAVVVDDHGCRSSFLDRS